MYRSTICMYDYICIIVMLYGNVVGAKASQTVKHWLIASNCTVCICLAVFNFLSLILWIKTYWLISSYYLLCTLEQFKTAILYSSQSCSNCLSAHCVKIVLMHFFSVLTHFHQCFVVTFFVLCFLKLHGPCAFSHAIWMWAPLRATPLFLLNDCQM